MMMKDFSLGISFQKFTFYEMFGMSGYDLNLSSTSEVKAIRLIEVSIWEDEIELHEKRWIQV